MKGIFIILDGVGDLPHSTLKGKTPLEAAHTPNLDYFARKGELGYVYVIKEGFIPESDNAVVSLFGNNPFESSRGWFEAIGAGLKLQKGDLAIRTNFGTIESLESRKIIDRRAGRTLTTKEASILAKAINKQVKLSCPFVFKNTVQHRGALVLRGGFSDNISGTDPTYNTRGKIKERNIMVMSKPLDDDDENAQHSANIVNDFVEKSYRVLSEHPLNKNRKKKGLLPTNILFLRGPGIEDPRLKKYKKWFAVPYMPLEIGIAKVSEMDVFSFKYPKLKKYDIYSKLYDGLNVAIKFSKKMLRKKFKRYDYCYLHFKEFDTPGHDNKPLEKKKMIELIDKRFFSFLKSFTQKNNIQIVVTADHSTPCKLKAHSADPVPLLWFNRKSNTKKRFTERESRKGKLGKIYGKDVLKKVGFA